VHLGVLADKQRAEDIVDRADHKGTYGKDHEAARQGLSQAAGFLRTELAHRMRMRTVPKLNFHYDESVERGAHLSHLIDQAVEEDRKHHPDTSQGDDEAQG
jgi:ribosome-binding factor A